MVVQIDTREKSRAIKQIIKHFDDNGIKYVSSKLDIGDYADYYERRIVVDRKQNLLELCANVCSEDHQRFRHELAKAKELGVELVFLVEHGDDIKTLNDVMFWTNPRTKTSPKATTGERLYMTLSTIQEKYGCRFEFCNKSETGKRIIEILTGGVTDG